MSKTIRFLGGPKNQELRAVDDRVTRVEFCELPETTEVPLNHKVKLIHHVYLEAFENAPYFKYQGIEMFTYTDWDRWDKRIRQEAYTEKLARWSCTWIPNRYDLFCGFLEAIKKRIGRKEILRWHHLHNLNRTQEQFDGWWEGESLDGDEYEKWAEEYYGKQ